MQFEVLGPVRFRHDADVVSLAGRLRSGLFGLLVARANESVPADVLMDALWGGHPDPRAPQKLQQQVHRLRTLLGDAERLSFGAGGYRLRVLPGELDTERFEALVDEADSVAATDPKRCAELIREALRIWRGRPYQDLNLDPLAGEVQRLSERRLVALEELYTAELAGDRHAVIVGELTELVRQHPLRERLHGLLMTALHRNGRQTDALAAYQDARRVLVDQHGLEPGPELRVLERQILAGEPVGPEVAQRVARPAQLPHDVAGFVGRDGELAELDRAAAEVDRSVLITVISGTAGVGKTALAVRWAHGADGRFPDGQLYVDLRGYGPDQPMSPDDALAGFLRALGVDGAAIPQDRTERAARFRTLTDGKRMLIVLDNARTADQVRPLLPGSAPCLVLVTSRDRLTGLAAREGVRRVNLDRMTTGEAHDLLTRLIDDRVTAEPHATAQLIERCARLPLALRIAAERIGERRGSSIGDLVTELADEQHRLDLLDAGDGIASPRAVFSWSYQHLDPEAARLFRLCGLHPGHDIDGYALAALLGSDLRTTRRLLDSLTRAHLVDQPEGGRYQLHDLLRAYAAELEHATDTEQDRGAALTRLFDHYLHTAARAMNLFAQHEVEFQPEPRHVAAPSLAGYQQALRWLDTERANLMCVAQRAPECGLTTYTTALSTVLWRYLDVGGYRDDGQRLHTLALTVARDQHDRVAEGIASRAVGIVNHRWDRYDQAAQHLEHSAALLDELGAKKSLAITLNYLAGPYHYTGRSDDAIRLLQRCLDLFRGLGDRSLLARPLSNLGLLYRSLGQHERAFECFENAVTIAEEYDHPPVLVHALRHLAGLCADVARYDEALAYAQRALALAKENGIHNIQSMILNHLGTVYRRVGDHEKAVCHLEEALALARTIGDRRSQARVLNGLAETHFTAGAPAEAARRHDDALTIASADGVRPEQARAHAGLGDVHDRQGDQEKATEHWRQALDIYRALGAPEAAQLHGKLRVDQP